MLANGEESATLARERLVDRSLAFDDERPGRVVAAHIVLEHAVEDEHELGAPVLVEIAVRAWLEPQQERGGAVRVAGHEQRAHLDAVATVLDPRLPGQIGALEAVPDHSRPHQVRRSVADSGVQLLLDGLAHRCLLGVKGVCPWETAGRTSRRPRGSLSSTSLVHFYSETGGNTRSRSARPEALALPSRSPGIRSPEA